MDKRFLEDCLARGMSLEAIGDQMGKHPSTIGYWLKKHELKAVGQERFSPRGGIERAILEPAVENGLTLNEMAEMVNRDISTVRYWLKQYGLRATGGSRRRETREAKQWGERHIERSCPRHGRTRFVLENRGSYRCMKCRGADVSAWRRRAKERLVEEAGGRCQICGYAQYLGALQFHHLDPSVKAFSLSRRGCTRAFAEASSRGSQVRVALCELSRRGGEWCCGARPRASRLAPPGGFEPPRTD
jgi:transposase/DNA-directed RNA polymerase subunit RPC12/RpoP